MPIKQSETEQAMKIPVYTMILVCLGCSSMTEWQNLPTSATDQHTLYVVSHGWHTGIVLNGNDLGESLLPIEKQFGKHHYYEIGWGDKGFYQAKEITISLILDAVFLPTESVMHVVAFNATPASYFTQSEVVPLIISSKGLLNLQKFLAASFSRNDQGEILQIGSGIYGNSLFFNSDTPYHLMHTCNTWVAEALAVTGAPVSGFLTLRARSVISQVKSAAQKQRCCPE